MARVPAVAPVRATTLILLRHGLTRSTGRILPGRAPGLHLSERGRVQAEAAAAALSELPAPGALYTSPLERTRETAAPVARALGLRARSHRGLLECDFGDWTGRSLAQLRRTRDWSTVQHAPSAFRFPGGESFAEMQRRIWDTLGELAAAHPGQSVVAVSHADPIKAALTYALGVPLDLFQRTVVSPGSLSVLVLGAGAPVVLCVNRTGSLSELVAS